VGQAACAVGAIPDPGHAWDEDPAGVGPRAAPGGRPTPRHREPNGLPDARALRGALAGRRV